MMRKICRLGAASVLLLACAPPESRLHTFTQAVGAAKVSLLSEGQNTGNSAALIGATPEMFRAFAPDSTYPSAINAFLVQLPEHLILVDGGLGRRLLQNMESLGVDAEQIDIVTLTHLHIDHIEGLLLNGSPAFPNATVYVSQAEYDYWTSDVAMNSAPESRRTGFTDARRMLAAYKEQLQLINTQDVDSIPISLAPRFYAIAAPGHTPGHTMFLVESGFSKFLIWGDITHAMAIQMPYPEVAVVYDVNPEQAVVTRQKVIDYVVRHHIPIAGAHIAYPGMGHIVHNGHDGYLFQPADLKEKMQQAVREQLEK
jgi:glyoxylase-like metal-dependent hydrolase (beta-lactamase superfamily II)